MKVIRIHKAVAKELEFLHSETRESVVQLLDLLAHGESLGLPTSRPMPSVEHGVHELRVKDKSGQYRVFYFTKQSDAVLIFHMFKKKTQQTPKEEIRTGQKRLKEMLS